MLMCIALVDAVEAHLTARDALMDTPTHRLEPSDPRFAAVADTLAAMRIATEMAKSHTPAANQFAADFLAHIERSDTDDLDFGRGLVFAGLIERARSVVAGGPQ